ncbi:Fasciclin-like arabinogalactan protein 9 [Zea mays]|uniref:Fasciclin-like arabinogalactan protein 9 n=1 Tax=Zea mays TaxID=4577 RepID=A0A3L6DTV2_MAIZE|nr:Fasciclin-like arabinogalactan protein 9 [Zea mays]
MKSTQQDTQLNGQLNNSFGSGYTVFAPTDSAFSSLKPGTLNKLSQQEQVSLVQYHVLPQFYSLDSFETASNPVRTQASGSDGPYTLNITADSSGQANVSTGLVATRVGQALRAQQPLAVYSVDQVLLANDLFGVKPPASAPPAARKPAKGGSVAEAPAAGSADAPPSGAAARGASRTAGWSSLPALLFLAAAASFLSLFCSAIAGRTSLSGKLASLTRRHMRQPANVNKALKDDQFSEFKQLLHDTRVDTQINAQLTDSYNGLTIMAPTNAAFDKMKAGVLNGLSPQDQIQLVLYCVLPRFYSLSMLGTLDGKVNTQGSGHDGPYRYDIKRSGNNVNVSTGVNWMLLGSPVSKDFPLAIYPVDKVPLPYELFGPKPPTPAPAPAPAPAKSKTKKKKKAAGIAEPPTADDDTSASDDQKAAATPGAAGSWAAAALSALAAAALGAGLF